ncbi:MAG: hypothetical protein Q7S40_04375 [Opitutaceae bacterium]|nr:hypothetical protein [Opitutaceae bacterium]
MNDLTGRLYFTDVPFTPQQAAELIRLVNNASTELRFPPPPSERSADLFRRTRDWDRIQSQAGSFLSPEQLRGLQAAVAVRRNKELLAAAVHDAANPKP